MIDGGEYFCCLFGNVCVECGFRYLFCYVDDVVVDGCVGIVMFDVVVF